MATAETAARARAAKRDPKRKQKPSRTKQRIAKAKKAGAGIVKAGEVYPLAVFQELTELGDWALTQAEEKGLEIFCVGNKRFITGDEYLRYLQEQRPKKGQG